MRSYLRQRLPLFTQLAFALMLLSAFCRSASAGTLNVPGQYATIQSAVNAAQNGDMVLIADGTYTGPGNVDIDFVGKNITVMSQNGAASTIIDCGGSVTVDHRGFYLHRGETNAVISGLTIQNAEVGGSYPNSPNYPGGAILSYGGLTLQSCIIKNNTAGVGGGLYEFPSQGTSLILNCVFSGNTAGSGGGLYLGSGSARTVSVTNCTITGNTAKVSNGGGICTANYSQGGVTQITNSILYGDTGGEAGQDPSSSQAAFLTYCDVQGGSAGTGNISADPLFVTTSNLHLQRGSPCLGAGTASGAPATTLDAKTRPNPPSIGAYEQVANGSVATTTTLYSTSNPSLLGRSVTFTATVTSGSSAPTGSITFTIDGQPQPPVALSGGYYNSSSYSTSSLAAGSHSIQAAYSGDVNFASSTAPALTQIVNAGTSATALTSSVNPSAFNQTIALTATVTGSNPTGNVTFTDTTTGIALGSAGVYQGVATLSLPYYSANGTIPLSVGKHQITASYGGDNSNNTSTSPPLSQTVQAASTTVTLTSTPSPSIVNQNVTFFPTVLGQYGGTPGGTITFTVDNVAQTPVPLNMGYRPFYTTSTLSVGTHRVTASYSGDTNFMPSVSLVLTQVVNPHISPQYVSPSGNDNDSGTLAAPKLTIQAAVNTTINGDMVVVEDGTYTGPGDVDLDLGGRNITVTSQNGAATTIINCGGSSAANHRGFYLHSGETSAVISGLTIENGYESADSGGGIDTSNIGATIQNCTFKNDMGSYGGGIENITTGTATLTVTGCTFSSNAARYFGGGLDNFSRGTLIVTGCAFLNNSVGSTSISGFGGGINTVNDSGGVFTATNCIFAGNQATGPGGGINNNNSNNNTSGTSTLTNCTFTGNTASYSSGGMNNQNGGTGTISLTNDIFYGDTGGEVAGAVVATNNCDIQGSYSGTGALNTNPLFVDALSDLHLQPTSPCLGMGTSSGAPATTIDGQTRPTPPSIGAYEILPAAAPSLINDTDSRIVYSGAGWSYYSNRGIGDFRDDVHATYNNGDSASYSFAGSSISVLTETNPDEGTADVYIDGVYQKTINCYSPARQVQQTVYSISGLPQGTHTLKLTKTSGGYMLLDALLAAPAPVSSSTINDADFGIAYTGSSWGYYPSRGVSDFKDDVHAATTNGDSFSYTFTGTGVSYLAETDYDEGNVQIFLDGALQTTVNCYSPFRKVQQNLWSATGLRNAGHTLAIVKQDGQYMLLDALQVSPAVTVGASTLVNDTVSSVAYTGNGWAYYPNRGVGDTGDDVHATTINGDSVSYTFTGTSISYLAETNFDEGTVAVYIDGVLKQSVNGYAPSRLVQQSLYSISGLASETHTIKLVKTGGNYMLLDAFNYQ